MALPTIEKTWQYSVNNVFRSTGVLLSDNRRFLRAFKNVLIGFGSNPWTVAYSCDSVAAGSAGDGVDRWAVDTNLVWAAAAHSWIVLKQAGVASNFQIVIDLNLAVAQSYQATIAFSVNAGFTGGTTSARPTATDQVVVLSAASWAGQTTIWDGVLHVMQSTDGQCTRAFLMGGAGAAKMTFIADRPKLPPAAWTYPAVFSWSTSAPTYALYNDVAKIYGYYSNDLIAMNATSESVASAAVGEMALGQYDEIADAWPILPIRLASETPGKRGHYGQLFDMWWTSTLLNDGMTFPDGTSRTHCKLAGNVVVPWNGTVPLVHL